MDGVDDVIDLLRAVSPRGAHLLVVRKIAQGGVLDLFRLVGYQEDSAVLLSCHALDGLDREHQGDVVRMPNLPVPTGQSRLLNPTNDHHTVGQGDPFQEVVVDGDALAWIGAVEVVTA